MAFIRGCILLYTGHGMYRLSGKQHYTVTVFTLLICLVILSSCTTKRPVLYPNAHLKTVGKEASEHDIDECLRYAASEGLEKEAGNDVAAETAKGAVTGAAVGGAAGAVTGHPGRGAAAGGSGGGVAGLLRALFRADEPGQLEKRFVEECLREKGYRPIGWK